VGIPGLAAAWLWHHFYCRLSAWSNLSERDGMALSKTIGLGVIARCSFGVNCCLFGVYTPTNGKIAISGLGCFCLLALR